MKTIISVNELQSISPSQAVDIAEGVLGIVRPQVEGCWIVCVGGNGRERDNAARSIRAYDTQTLRAAPAQAGDTSGPATRAQIEYLQDLAADDYGAATTFGWRPDLQLTKAAASRMISQIKNEIS